LVRLFDSGREQGETGGNDTPASSQPHCDGCGRGLEGDLLYARYAVCGECGHHHQISAAHRIAILADPGTFKQTHANLYPTDPLGFVDRVPYIQRLEEARRKTRLADAIVTGTCRIDGHDAVLAAMDFGFLGGSMGSVVGEKVAAAAELAERRRLPLVVVTTSGGARMQEGMLALAQMAKTAAAVEKLHAKGVPFVVLMAHPTTGGVYASFGTLGDIILAEPGALISFAGPRVARAMAGESNDPPRDAEFMLENGQLDAVVPRPRAKALIGEILRLACTSRLKVKPGATLPPPAGEAAEAWAAVQRARHGNRPTSMDYLHRIASSFVEIRGDRATGEDPAVVCGLADLDGQVVMLIAQERGHEDAEFRRGGRARPQGYRKAIRAMRLAAKWGLPVLALVDTPGADPSADSDARGLGGAIAHCMAAMSHLQTPVLSVVIGEGGSGGALALAVADRVLMMENAIFSVIAPEGAAAILYRDASQAADVAPSLRLTSRDLLELGVVDEIVTEPEGGAHLDHERAALLLRRAVREALAALSGEPVQRLVKRRYHRWRQIGRTTTAAAATAERLAGQVGSGLREGAQKLTELGRLLPGSRGDTPGERDS
jgi:acyl-CoA carboxylase subunit beta